ncbi:hypothetical protein MAR621_04081 [Maribacter dokdonensis]|uniref:hypothetical protein n=1 Tax=Maribacter dokdonensis TaxID=320912 RepID=UPI001B21B1FD|nr:hypothetical protein [Maribacter dokdonensis]CAG2534392.1 hypothetical protein MAR621_04081 [Maribacter dokdonensis]
MKFFLFLFYRSVAMYLPKSNKLYIGKLCKSIRGYIASKLFVSAGKNINIEKGARFPYRNSITIGDNSGIGINANIPPKLKIGDYSYPFS